MAVPLHNLYYLLCYAWNKLEPRELIDVGTLPADLPQNLFGKLLATGANHLLRRGLDRGYLAVEEDLRTPRGKFLLAKSVKRNLLQGGRVACSYDEFSHDVLHNRILKATMRTLCRTSGVDAGIAHELRTTLHRFHDVSNAPIGAKDFDRVQLHSNNAYYSFLLDICELVHRQVLPKRGAGKHDFPDFRDNEQTMGALFEAFVFNFLRREQSQLRVSRSHFQWLASAEHASALKRLPGMRTDITLRAADQTTIVETKFYKQPLALHHGRESVRAQHLYQLFAYLQNYNGKHGAGQVNGILLYAGAGREFDFKYELHGHNVRVRTLDLAQPWDGIRDDLLGLANELTNVKPAQVG